MINIKRSVIDYESVMMLFSWCSPDVEWGEKFWKPCV